MTEITIPEGVEEVMGFTRTSSVAPTLATYNNPDWIPLFLEIWIDSIRNQVSARLIPLRSSDLRLDHPASSEAHVSAFAQDTETSNAHAVLQDRL